MYGTVQGKRFQKLDSCSKSSFAKHDSWRLEEILTRWTSCNSVTSDRYSKANYEPGTIAHESRYANKLRSVVNPVTNNSVLVAIAKRERVVLERFALVCNRQHSFAVSGADAHI